MTFLFQNSPLYVLCSNIDKEIELQYRIHSALDIIDEKGNAASNKNPDMRDLFLGLLYATETYKM
jgi:trafficking protein particle complex subunit 2